MKKSKTKLIFAVFGIILIIVIAGIITFYFQNDNDSKIKKKKEYNFDFWDTTPVLSSVVEDKGNYWKIELTKMRNGSLNFDDAKFQLITKGGIVKVSKTEINVDHRYEIRSGKSVIRPISYQINKPIYENSILGDGEAVDKDSINNLQIWEGCFFAYCDARYDEKVNPGDIIWLYKDWNDDDIYDVLSDWNFRILDYDNDTVMNKSLSDNDGPYNESLCTINITDYQNYWEIEIKNIKNDSILIEDNKFNLMSEIGIVKFDHDFFKNDLSVYSFNNSNYYFYAYDDFLPIENATTGDGEPIDYFSFDKPEIWEECIFTYIDKQSDDKINSGDILWIFKDWNDDDINEISIDDKIYIRNDYYFEIVMLINFD